MCKNRTLRVVMALAFVLSMVIGIVPGPAEAASSSDIKKELAALKNENSMIQNQINAIRSQYNANATEISDMVAKKDGIDQEISLLHTQIININNQIMTYGQMIADSQEELDLANSRLTELNQKHRERVRAMEEEGSVSYWQVIFQSHDFTDMLDRINLVNEIAQSDQKRLAEIEEAALEVAEIQGRLEDELLGMEDAKALLEESQVTLEQMRAESDEVLRQLLEKQDEFQVLLDESEALQDELMKDIAAKQKELQAAQYQENLAKLALQGNNPPSNAKWITPVSGYVISSAFGMRVHPVLGYSRMHNGIDMACAQGTPIYATRAGTVTTASYQAGGAGNYVSISHGDGFASIYMHMTRYVVYTGQTVTAGQLIGYVGSTGISTGPHLHFGISYAGTYVNPLAYIG